MHDGSETIGRPLVAIDTSTGNLAGVPPNSNDYAAERGNGDFDIRHRFTLSATYDCLR